MSNMKTNFKSQFLFAFASIRFASIKNKSSSILNLILYFFLLITSKMLSKIVKIYNLSLRAGLGGKQMSVYAPIYVEPVFKKEKQTELQQTGEAIKLSHIPIKPARNNDNCSVFHDDTISKFTNHIMRKGNKILARNLLERSFENIKRIQLERYNLADADEKHKIETNPKVILLTAIENSRPLLHLTPIKRGGVRYQVPVPVTEKRSIFLAMKWLIESAKEKERTVHFPEKLAWELIDAAAGQGKVIKRKLELHKQCEANRAYAHYRWS